MENRKTDLLIVGSGAAGLAAAIAAAETGISVTVIEKRNKIGGISVTGMGIFAIGTRQQKLKNLHLSKQEVFHSFMESTFWKADARLISKFINRSAETVEWLESMGIRFELLDIIWGDEAYNLTGHIVCTPDGLKLRGGITNYMIEAMLARAKELGCEIITETELTDIIKTDGKITGVKTVSAQGEETMWDVKACVIASGGYLTHPEMVREYNGRELNKDFFCMHKIPLDGKGIELAWKAGADSDAMALQQAGYIGGIDYQKYPDVRRVPQSHLLTSVIECPFLNVNLDGKRFHDESVFGKTKRANAISRQKECCAYAIIDSASCQYLETEGVDDVGYMERKDFTLPNIEKIIHESALEQTPYIIEADSPEELAEKMGVPVDTFLQTLTEYNTYCDQGYDEQFGKRREWLQKISGPKYYALKIRVQGYGTIGGIRINDACEALNHELDPIPGLYAAGDCANAALAVNYACAFTFWGSTLSLAVNTGRFAGESAAQYIYKENE